MALKLAVLIAALACTPALASPPPQHAGQLNGLAVTLSANHSRIVTVRSHRLLPGVTTPVYVDATFNGHRPQMVWADSKMQLEYAWRGVIVTVSVTKHVGPAYVRAASTRTQPVAVRVTFNWR